MYCVDLFQYKRFPSRAVKVGSIGIGGDHPIRLQSMTTVDTMDTEGTVAESIRMIEAGCELVRITAPSKNEAENLANIKKMLVEKGYPTPLVADIHFTPNAAEIAAKLIEKVRVNPGNYADKKKFEEIDYTDETYQAELKRIEERFTPLVLICKEHGTAMRIGTNHGSLSDRILSRYGDTPEGMVESAMEFLRICRKNDFHEIVISMKASNTLVMVQAYRLLMKTMIDEGMNYPLHLGVTEAGDGEDGRIKSAVGIGTLLEDGIGDTIRVSLTEAPEFEIPVAKILADRYHNRSLYPETTRREYSINPFSYQRRETFEVNNIGGKHTPVVIMDLSHRSEINPSSFFGAGYQYSVPMDKWNLSDLACDYIFIGDQHIQFDIPGTLGIIQNGAAWLKNTTAIRTYPCWSIEQYLSSAKKHEEINFIQVQTQELTDGIVEDIKKDPTAVILLSSIHPLQVMDLRSTYLQLMNTNCKTPVIVHTQYTTDSEDAFMLNSAVDQGALFIDGLGDGLMMTAQNIALQRVNSSAFGILQATRTRISKTEYISCPSCGRTLFDLQETTAKIRSRTSHLKGVKIGIMGCIVNGPGEMADADYGYVGTGPGKITLYKEKTVVKKNVPEEEAVDELIALIREHGDWVEPVAV
ncbi:MAG: 4-hydroxy-3-methylbut-2-en-yl diphosphate synthase [Bacteroidota bacterium]|jgi:(E)-4-hydroxy-3-methylbut-2-enyl-diphosphate synthase